MKEGEIFNTTLKIANFKESNKFEIGVLNLENLVFLNEKDFVLNDGETKDIEISFLQVASGEGEGLFTLASAFTQRIPVLVVGEPTESAVYGQKPKTSITTWVVLALIILGVIVVAVMIRRRRR